MKDFIICNIQLFIRLMIGVLGEEYRTDVKKEFIQSYVFKFVGKGQF